MGIIDILQEHKVVFRSHVNLTVFAKFFIVEW